MLKKSILFLLFAGLGLGVVRAQSLERFAIGCIGGLAETANISMSWTGGQTASRSYGGSNLLVTEGFQQPWLDKIISIDDKAEAPLFTATLFPNPTTGKVFIQFETPQNGKLSLEAFNILGQTTGLKRKVAVTKGQTLEEFDLTELAKGVYFVQVSYQPDGGTARVFSQRIVVF